jgi:anti-sigma factor RsiW
MSCEWQEKITAFVDDELETAAQEQVSAHVSGCAECTAAIAEQLAMKKAVRVAANRYSAPPELHATIYRQLHPAKSFSMRWKWLAATASLAVITVALLLGLRKPDEKSLVAGLIDQHITTLASSNPVDVQSPDTHKIRPWFQGKLPFTFYLPNVEGSSYALVGAKEVFVQQRPGAQVLYSAGGHKISVFIFQASESSRSAPSWKRERSFNSCNWREGGLEFHMITDANQKEAYRLAEMFEETNRS